MRIVVVELSFGFLFYGDAFPPRSRLIAKLSWWTPAAIAGMFRVLGAKTASLVTVELHMTKNNNNDEHHQHPNISFILSRHSSEARRQNNCIFLNLTAIHSRFTAKGLTLRT